LQLEFNDDEESEKYLNELSQVVSPISHMSPRGNHFMSNNTQNENCDIPGEEENVSQAQRTRSSISCKRSVVSIDTQKMRDSFTRLGRE
jgi:hypothetical protein